MHLKFRSSTLEKLPTSLVLKWDLFPSSWKKLLPLEWQRITLSTIYNQSFRCNHAYEVHFFCTFNKTEKMLRNMRGRTSKLLVSVYFTLQSSSLIFNTCLASKRYATLLPISTCHNNIRHDREAATAPWSAVMTIENYASMPNHLCYISSLYL